MSETTVLAARGLAKTYAADGVPVRAVDEVDLTVEAGETVSVMGPSGCGKSTLLHLLGGLERPDAGEIVLGGRRVDGLSETAWAVLLLQALGLQATPDRLQFVFDWEKSEGGGGAYNPLNQGPVPGHPELSGGNAARDALPREGAAGRVTLDTRLPRLRTRAGCIEVVARRIAAHLLPAARLRPRAAPEPWGS